MAGILNNKKRVMDTIITLEGRRQVADGELQIKFASFTDMGTFYTGNSGSIADDASSRLYFEACNRQQDQIIFETDDAGRLMPFRGGDVEISGGKLLSGSAPSESAPSGKRLQVLTGSIRSAAQRVLETSTTNFQDQYIIGTTDPFSESNAFSLYPKDMKFRITDSVPFQAGSITKSSINDVESLFQDVRLSHLPNYRYLPPVNRREAGRTTGKPLGTYKKLNQAQILTYQDLMQQLENKESIEIRFSETSKDNNIVCQMLDVRPDGIEKLAIIDFGEFPDEDPYSAGVRVFFLGRVYQDDFGNATFVNLFTVILD